MEVQAVSLSDAARERYLSYALSVITARALPDVRDGLKPVQRRILYTMYEELGLDPGGRYRKCAAVVGEVMGKYHPHGDQSIYDALVRMAQDFSLRAPLVDPQGNFGSLDGDPPAAMRYTECKLKPIALELLREIRKDTVDVRPTYDGQRNEPEVLPAQFPQLLVNGVEGIAVGLSTRIPPHNLGEVVDACVALIDGEAHDVPDLLRHVRGPDFPTGGRILNDPASLREIYETGQGSVRIRGEWRTEKEGRRLLVVVTSIPYGVNKAKLIETIGIAVEDKKLPQVTDVRDESTEEVRIVLELKGDASPEAVMAWVYKRTDLETTFPVNMNALVPNPDGGLPQPVRLDLKTMLEHWLDFRYETIRRRFTYDLRLLEERIHILEGFAIVFADLDEVIRIVRESEGKKDAARKLIERFGLSELQTEAILELRLYRLARLEIQIILDELEEKRAAAAEIREILGSEARLWQRVRTELLELRALYDDKRRSPIGGEAVAPLTFDESAYIVREETFVVVTRDGWVKRQQSFTALDKIKRREGDEIGWLMRADTAGTLTFLGSDGGAYTLRVGDVPPTTGHGKPLSTFFAIPDGARIAGVVLHDPAVLEGLPADPAPPPEDPAPPFVVSVTKLGRIQRLPLEMFAEPSNKNGRIFARLDAGDEVLAGYVAMGGESVCVATKASHLLAFPLKEAPALKAAGKGTTAIKLHDDDEVIAFELSREAKSGPLVVTGTDREVTVTPDAHGGSRAGRGRQILKRDGLKTWIRKPEVHAGKAPPPRPEAPESAELTLFGDEE